MVAMRLRPLLVACAAVAEIVPLENAGLLEELHRAIDRGNGNPRVALDGPLIDQLHIRMVVGLRQHVRNDATLLGHLQTLGDAQFLQTTIHEHPFLFLPSCQPPEAGAGTTPWGPS